MSSSLEVTQQNLYENKSNNNNDNDNNNNNNNNLI